MADLRLDTLSFTHSTEIAADDGTITIAATGGSLPYQYSNDDGATWQSNPLFDDLAPGDYDMKIKDDDDTIVGGITVTISEPIFRDRYIDREFAGEMSMPEELIGVIQTQ